MERDRVVIFKSTSFHLTQLNTISFQSQILKEEASSRPYLCSMRLLLRQCSIPILNSSSSSSKLSSLWCQLLSWSLSAHPTDLTANTRLRILEATRIRSRFIGGGSEGPWLECKCLCSTPLSCDRQQRQERQQRVEVLCMNFKGVHLLLTHLIR